MRFVFVVAVLKTRGEKSFDVDSARVSTFRNGTCTDMHPSVMICTCPSTGRRGDLPPRPSAEKF